MITKTSRPEGAHNKYQSHYQLTAEISIHQTRRKLIRSKSRAFGRNHLLYMCCVNQCTPLQSKIFHDRKQETCIYEKSV